MELKEGMYVRIDGRNADSIKYQNWFMIDKISYIDNGKSKYKYLLKEDKDGYSFAVSDKMIVKASFDIIDLIQVGDYVNGNKVTFITTDYVEVTSYYEDYLTYKIEDIKTIVTKEQFESMSYKVGE